MADPPSGDRPTDSTGTLEGQQEREPRAVDSPGHAQTLADGLLTVGETDQTLADADQTGADSDQSSADRDQFAADRDQEASDRDLAHGVDPGAHEFTRDLRQRSARQRDMTAVARLETADQRDAGALARDLAALARDQAAAARDLAMTQRDQLDQAEHARAVTDSDIVLRAADQRKRAARHRVEAAAHRAQAAEDRDAALRDREQAARERMRALADRQALARQLEIAETDALTGVRARAAGLIDLDHELDRCRRSGGVLIVAYIDVVGLKALNDSAGHSAGDGLLRRVVALLRSHLRSYDLIIRLGGDEFLCAMSNMALSDARDRIRLVGSALAASADAGAIRAGLAELGADEDAESLIARADAELLASRAPTPR